MDVQHCAESKVSRNTDGFDSTNYPLLLDRVSLAFLATRCCTGSTFCNRVVYYYVARAYGIVHKRSATKYSVCIAEPPWIPLRQDDVRDLREIATVIHRTCVREYCVRSLAFTL